MTARPLTDRQAAALELVYARSEGNASTYVVDGTPVGDAAITEKTAEALIRRGLVTIVRGCAWPTEAGARAAARHRRIAARQAATEPTTAQG